MLLIFIYIGLYLLTATLFFSDSQKLRMYKNSLLLSHLFSLLLLVLDFFLINLKGALLDRIIVLAFLTTGAAIFSLYRRNLRPLMKCYFGFFLVYPIVALAAYLLDKILFTVIASPLIATLIIPQNVFSNTDYDIREQVVVLAPKRLELIQKSLITERVIGICSDENIVYLDILAMEIRSQTIDSIHVMVKTRDAVHQAAFAK